MTLNAPSFRYRPRPKTFTPAPQPVASTCRFGNVASDLEALRLHTEYLAINALKTNPRHARKHSTQAIEKLAVSMRNMGFIVPLIVNADGMILAGHGRYRAAQKLGLKDVPVIRVHHLTEAMQRAYALADNKLAELGCWDDELLRIELQALIEIETTDVDFQCEFTGFSTADIDIALATPGSAGSDDECDPEPALQRIAITRCGDLWWLGPHRVICGDSMERSVYEALLGSDRAQIVIADPPYNVPIDGYVGGLGKHKHREFAMASGEMTSAQFTAFLTGSFALLKAFSNDGSLHYQFMDKKHIAEILAAGVAVYDECKDMLVWVKTNAGMGSLYRSQHELIFLFKHGTAPHVNNIRLGATGRYRTNVLTYAGANTFRPDRDDDLAAHPTPKPVGLIADLLRDTSRRHDLVLDNFGGGGTTLMAAERTGRRAALIEIDPLYVDATLRRWQRKTGLPARLAATGETFTAVEQRRCQDATSVMSEEADHEPA